MKKVILAAVSGVALMGVAYAQDAKKAEAPASVDKNMPAKAAVPAGNAAADAHKKPAEHHHHKKHHKHPHGDSGRTEIDGVYVTMPVNVNGQIEFLPEYYAGQKNYPYMYHGGYFWYPHAHNNVLQGYKPHCANNACWYASYTHPHMVYIQGENMVAVHPYVMDGAMYERHHAPMTQKWDSAPDRK
jgi:opacity protein-like surface antigen